MKQRSKAAEDFSCRILHDISRAAHNKNTNSLTYEDYRKWGGIYSEEMICAEFSSFAQALELCGLKVRRESPRT